MIYIDQKIEDFDLKEALAMVSQQRRDHALRYRQERDQRLSLGAYRLLQRALNVEYGITEPPVFDYDSHGKPLLTDYPHIFFNMSHLLTAIEQQRQSRQQAKSRCCKIFPMVCAFCQDENNYFCRSKSAAKIAFLRA